MNREVTLRYAREVNERLPPEGWRLVHLSGAWHFEPKCWDGPIFFSRPYPSRPAALEACERRVAELKEGHW